MKKARELVPGFELSAYVGVFWLLPE